MKKITLSITLVLFSFSLFLTAASAADFDNATMVSYFNDTNPKTGDYLYGVEEPWFFLEFENLLNTSDIVGASKTTAIWTWDNTTGRDKNYIKFYNSTENGIWGNLDEWDTAEQLGNWTIQISTPLDANPGSGVPSDTYTKTLNFKVSNVVPEPASALLYILGGGSLLAGFLRKKKA